MKTEDYIALAIAIRNARDEFEEKLVNLAEKIADFDKDIKTMTEYKAFMERQKT